MLPARIAEIARAVAAPEEIDLKNEVTKVREPSRLKRRHAARLVHLLGEGMHVQNAAARFTRRPVHHAEAIASLGRQEEGFEHAGAAGSGSEVFFDQHFIQQHSKSLEDGAAICITHHGLVKA